VGEHWIHDLSPFLIEIRPGIGLRWYGLAYLAGLLWGYWMVRRWVLRCRVPLALGEIQDFVLFAGLGMIIGGRVGYCLLYNLEGTLRDPLYLLRVWEGGMASHGGIIGLTVGCWWFARRRGRSFLVLGDLIAATGPMGIALGRIANFINGELWGRPSNVPWAVIFPDSVPVPEGLPASQGLAWQIANAVPRHPSQLYAAFLEGFILLAILLPIHARHRRPGLTGGLFFVLYAVGRFFGEFFREPDVGQPVFFGWMTKGQLYTVPLFIAGLVMVALVLRRPARPDQYLLPQQEPVPAIKA
jgi:phosphatidylglycerol:prolipoprotein diacylglycerol transferase